MIKKNMLCSKNVKIIKVDGKAFVVPIEKVVCLEQIDKHGYITFNITFEDKKIIKKGDG